MGGGTKSVSRQQLQDALSELDVRISESGGLGRAGFSVRARKESLPAALDLLKQILREPALDEKEFDIMKRARISGLEESLSDPGRLGQNLFSRLTNPYPAGDVREVLTLEEEITALKKLTIDNVRQLYKEFLGAVAGELTIVGDFDPVATL